MAETLGVGLRRGFEVNVVRPEDKAPRPEPVTVPPTPAP